MRRLVTVVVSVLVLALVVALLVEISNNDSAGTTKLAGTDCYARRYIVLQAQSVPTAQLIPCVTDTLDGWTLATESYSNDGSSVSWGTSSSSTDSGAGAGWSVSLHPSCTPPADATVEPSVKGATVHSQETNENSVAVHQEWYQFTGGCVVSRIAIPDRFDEQRIFDELGDSFDLVSRAAVNDYVRADSDGDFGLDPTPAPAP